METTAGGPAPRNRTIQLNDDERQRLAPELLRTLPEPGAVPENRLFCGDGLAWLRRLPAGCCRMVFADPPYNMPKQFGSMQFRTMSRSSYRAWLEPWIVELRRVLAADGSIYLCGDWRSSSVLEELLEQYFIVRNRITWEREKGRGARSNWKNASEDIWFATCSNSYPFHVDQVKSRREVRAPYRDRDGKPKDWQEEEAGRFRLTHPSNLWTDLTVPYWSMPENTPHPTQKPEKLLARLVLASTDPGDRVLDPFAGSGTTAVVAAKLGRNWLAAEQEEEFCLLALARLARAGDDPSIQGYRDGAFLPRNSRG